MVGQAILRVGTEQGQELLIANRSDLNLRDSHAVSVFLQKHKPRNVILAAATVG